MSIPKDGRYTLIETEEGKLDVEWFDDTPFLHLELHKMSPQAYKKYKKVFSGIKEKFKSLGYDKLYVLIPDNDTKLLKFEHMFGFSIEQHLPNSYLLSLET